MLVQIAKYLDSKGVGVFDEVGTNGTIYISFIPQMPDAVIGIFSTGGAIADGKIPYDLPTVQIIVRDTNPAAGFEKGKEIYNLLHGFHHDYFIAGGNWVLNCRGIQSQPIHIGRDENERHEYSLNFELEIENHTINREVY